MEEGPEKSHLLSEKSEGSNGIRRKPFTEGFGILENGFIR